MKVRAAWANWGLRSLDSSTGGIVPLMEASADREGFYMRPHLSGRQLSRNSAHRHALMRNMSVSLLRHETIRTTVPKAKELRRVVEPLITLAKKDSEANRRVAFARLG